MEPRTRTVADDIDLDQNPIEFPAPKSVRILRAYPAGSRLWVVPVMEAVREDGGLRVWSEYLRGLILSSKDVDAVRADIGIAITELLTMMGNNVISVERADHLPYAPKSSGLVNYVVRYSGPKAPQPPDSN